MGKRKEWVVCLCDDREPTRSEDAGLFPFSVLHYHARWRSSSLLPPHLR